MVKLTFPQIAQRVGVPANTLRRWAEAFPEFLPCRTEDRAKKFPTETLTTFRRIAELFREGKRTPEVSAILAAEFSPVLDVPQAMPEAVPALGERLPALVQAEIGRVLGESLAVIADQKKRLDAQDAQIEELKRKVADLEASRSQENPAAQAQTPEASKGFLARLFGG